MHNNKLTSLRRVLLEKLIVHSIIQEILHILWNLKVHHHVYNSPLFKTCVIFHNMLFFHGKELSAPSPNPNLDYPPLLAICNCLFNGPPSISGGLLHVRPEDAPCCGGKEHTNMDAKSQTMYFENTLTPHLSTMLF
jgi:hypothetical protein